MGQSGRIQAVDLARGVALIGMMFTHVGPQWIEENPPVGDMLSGGRAAPLFAMLAGVALTIVHQRDRRGAGSVRATVIRAALLIVLGLALGSLEHVPMFIILAYYGVLIVIVLPFRRVSATWLLVLGSVWAAAAPVVLLWAQREHRPVFSGQTQWQDLRQPGDLFMEIGVWGVYPVSVWIAYVLIGMAVGRLDLRSTLVAWRLAGSGAVLVIATLAVGLAAIRTGQLDDSAGSTWRALFAGPSYPYERPEWNELLLVGQHTSRPLGMFSAIGSAILVIGLCVLLTKVPWARIAMTPVRAAGAMTLTLYTVHVLWAWRLRLDFREKSPNGIAEGSYEVWLVQVVVLCAAATLWGLTVGKGPLEWLVRRLSVWGQDKEKSAPRGA